MKSILGGSLVALMLVLVGCVTAGNPAVGTWAVSMNTPAGAMPATLVINEDGSGSMSVDGMGTQEFSGVMVDGNSVNFSSAIDAGGQSITLTFNGLIDGDTISGAFDSDFGAFDVSGSRQ